MPQTTSRQILRAAFVDEFSSSNSLKLQEWFIINASACEVCDIFLRKSQEHASLTALNVIPLTPETKSTRSTRSNGQEVSSNDRRTFALGEFIILPL